MSQSETRKPQFPNPRPFLITVSAGLLAIAGGTLIVVVTVEYVNGARNAFYQCPGLAIGLGMASTAVGLWGMKKWALASIVLLSTLWLCALWFGILLLSVLLGGRKDSLLVPGLIISGIIGVVVWRIRQWFNKNQWRFT